MKRYKQILDDIRDVSRDIKAEQAKEAALVDKFMSADTIVNRINIKKSVEDEMSEVSQRIKDLKIAKKIMEHNVQVAMFHEVIPVALDVLSKYAGKPYGEKTRRKISDEVKEDTGCGFYIGSRYSSQTYEIYPTDMAAQFSHISCGTEWSNGSRSHLLIDNKIQIVPIEDIGLYYMQDEYVDDIDCRVQTLKTLYAAAVEKQKELDGICSQYNSLAVGGLTHIYKDKYIYEQMEI